MSVTALRASAMAGRSEAALAAKAFWSAARSLEGKVSAPSQLTACPARARRTAAGSGWGGRIPEASRTAINTPSSASRGPPKGARAAAAASPGAGKLARAGAKGGRASGTSLKLPLCPPPGKGLSCVPMPRVRPGVPTIP